MSTRPLILAASVVVLSGCAVGPDFHRPVAPSSVSYTAATLPTDTASTDIHGGEIQHLIASRDLPAQWWTLFHSPGLDTLIREAIAANPNVEAAQAALREAEENVAVQQTAFFPTVTGNVMGGRNKNSNVLSPTLNTPTMPLFNLYTAEVDVSYSPDVFGLNRRTVESLHAQAEYQRWELEATYLTLASNVAVAAIQEASLRGQIAATEDIVTAETIALAMTKQARALGQMSDLDVAQQKTVLAQTQAAVPPLRKALEQQRDALCALLGRTPDQEPSEQFTLEDLELPQDLPLSLPSQLVEQRPDIRAAEAQLHSASAAIGIAIANALPNIMLSGNIGTVATETSQLFGPGSGFWTIAGGATQTLFDAGASWHRVSAARRAFDQSAAQYRGTVVAAFQNVADALHALNDDATALKANAAAEQAARESLRLAQNQFTAGQISHLTLINAEQAYQQTRIAVVQAQASRFADTVALFQALGGGWWNRSD